MKNVPIKPGTVLKVDTNEGIRYVLYTGVGVGYLTGNPQQPRMQ